MENTEFESMGTEIKRGSSVLIVLMLLHEKQYGYELLEVIRNFGAEIESNTLYPLLRRLEKQGLLTSQWDIGESRPRKYYIISDKGLEAEEFLKSEWDRINTTIKNIAEKGRRNKE